jgi:hypothetical protein
LGKSAAASIVFSGGLEGYRYPARCGCATIRQWLPAFLDPGDVAPPSRGAFIKSRTLLILFALAAAGVIYYAFVYRPKHRASAEIAHVLPTSLDVLDTTAEVHAVIATLKHGDRVEVLGRTANWAQIRSPQGGVGWVEARALVDAETYRIGERLLKDLEQIPAQATGHTINVVNLRVEPSRDAPQFAQLKEHESLEIFARRLVDRAPELRAPGRTGSPPTDPGQASSAAGRDAWYLVRAHSQAGWVVGRSVGLDVPEGISEYAQGVNLVAWLVLNRVSDDGRQKPQYLVADRIDAPDFDFNHIRVFTWGIREQRYVTAYVEGNLNGYFPIRVRQENGIPSFRLRLVDEKGRKFQKVYGLFATMTRLIGIVDGWESDAIPAQAVSRRRPSR